MKFIKITLSLLLGLAFVVLVAAGVFIVTFDANDYREQISKQVERHTGRSFAIRKIQPSVFPWVGMELRGVELGNAAGFSEPEMLKVERLDVKVELLPLIRQQFHIDTLRLHGLKLSLGKDSKGRSNWDDILDRTQSAKPSGAAPVTAPEQAADKTDQSGESPLAALLVNGIEIRDAEIQWQDRHSGQQASLSQFNLTSGAFKAGQSLPLTMDTRVKLKQPDIETALSLEMEFKFDPQQQQVDVSDLQVNIKASGETLPGGELSALLKTSAHVDMQQQQVAVSALTLETLGIALSSQLNVTDYQSAPKVDGQVSVARFDANDVAKKLKISLPQMHNPDALKQLALTFNVKATDKSAELNDIQFKLDKSTIDGKLAINSFSPQAIAFDLKLDTIWLDDYLPTPVEPVATENNQTNKPLPPGQKLIADAPIDLPLELIRSLDVKGQFRAGHIEARSYELLNLLMQVQIKGGVASLSKLQAELLEGQLNATAQLDARQNIPQYKAAFKASGVKADSVVTPVLQDLLGETEVSLSGAANLDLDIASQGNRIQQLTENTNGQLSLNVGEAKLNGVDAEYFVRKAVAGYLESKNQGSEWVKGQYQPKQTTALKVARANAVIKNGIVTNNDLLLQASRYSITGAGKISIPDEKIDYRVIVDLQPASTQTTAEKLLDVPAPINVKGSFAQPEIALDKKVWLKGMSNALTAEARAQAKAAAEKKKQELQQQIELKKQQEREALRKKAEEEKQKLEQKAKDKLLDLFR